MRLEPTLEAIERDENANEREEGQPAENRGLPLRNTARGGASDGHESGWGCQP